MTLGTYPAVSLVEARSTALDKRHAIDVEKRDPAAEERAARATVAEPETPAPCPRSFTFSDLVQVYETFAKGRKKTWNDDIAMARRHLLPVWGSTPVRTISRAHVHELLDSLVAKGLTWATLMHRAFGLDVLASPRCGGRLRLIALIEEEAVIARVLTHLGLPTEVPVPRPARPPPDPEPWWFDQAAAEPDLDTFLPAS
jgi:hypothetical protein